MSKSIKGILVFFGCLWPWFAGAQRIGLVDFDDYAHHVQLNDHKAVFHLRSIAKGNVVANPKYQYHWYAANRLQQTQGGYAGRLLEGQYQSFHRSGQLYEQGLFKKGQKVGKWMEWSPGSQLLLQGHYRHGILDGAFKKYDSLGRVSGSGHYRDGLLDGKIFAHGPKERVLSGVYRKGVLVDSVSRLGLLGRWYGKLSSKLHRNSKERSVAKPAATGGFKKP